jgi:hypothetical protein
MFILVRCPKFKPLGGIVELTANQTKISDLVQITPEDFKKPSLEAIEDNINLKYANKVRPYCVVTEAFCDLDIDFLKGHSKDWTLHLSLRSPPHL